jgi:nucleoside-diphosphate-sugar epimerase
MRTILITGASGFIGRGLAKALAGRCNVVCLSRKKPDAPGEWVQGTFELFEDLRHLDRFKIDAAVHLAAVTGGCSEEDGMAINVQGTRRLLRYLCDRGTRRIVLASSIAATGLLTGSEPRFAPLHLPMAPEHPCVGRDAYGLSKLLMEEVAKHFVRNVPDAEITALRFGAVVDEATWEPSIMPSKEFPAWAMVLLGRVALGDVVAGVEATLDAPNRPGFHVYNLVGPDCCMDEPVAPAIRNILGPRASAIDLSAYEQPGHEYDPLFSMEETRAALGFVPQIPMRPERFKAWKAKRD